MRFLITLLLISLSHTAIASDIKSIDLSDIGKLTLIEIEALKNSDLELAANAHLGDLESEELDHLEKLARVITDANHVILTINQDCFGACSLIAMPLADEVKFSRDGNAYLTSSLPPFFGQMFVNTLFPDPTQSVSPENIFKTVKKTDANSQVIQNIVEIFAKERKSIGTLFLHGVFEEYYLNPIRQKCSLNSVFAIKLDIEYFDLALVSYGFQDVVQTHEPSNTRTKNEEIPSIFRVAHKDLYVREEGLPSALHLGASSCFASTPE